VEAILVGAGEGDVVADRAERTVRILAEHGRLCTTESRYAVGERGPGPHIHRRHSDCFYVLEGRLSFELAGGEPFALEACGLVAIPPEVVHTFCNEGPDEARFLNLHAPSCGFAEYLRRLHAAADEAEERAVAERFDTFPPPPDGGRPASEALVRRPCEGERVRLGASGALIRAGGDDGAGHVTVLETDLAPGFPGPVPHRHRDMVDSFYPLEGSLAITLDGAEREAGPGSHALAPPGAVHTFSNPSERRVRFLNVMAPGGFERYLKEVEATQSGAAPAPAEMARIASRYDFEPAG
jgi:mannose-6-phosphate isomerase-like protein (cupin superfamily)